MKVLSSYLHLKDSWLENSLLILDLKFTKPKSTKSRNVTVTPAGQMDPNKSPDVYDRPGLWKFLCLVCLEVSLSWLFIVPFFLLFLKGYSL